MRQAQRPVGVARNGVAALALVSLCIVLIPRAAADAQSTWVATDSSEYLANNPVAIAGGGFQPHEPLTLQVTHADGTAEADMGHEPATLSADAAGQFSATWTIAEQDVSGNDFRAQVTSSSGAVATAVFKRVAWIHTDKSDYQPGEAAIINGGSFAPSELVTLQVVHLTGAQDAGAGHEVFSATSDANGQLVSMWYVDPDDSRGSTFLLTAIGNTSGRAASTTFTDAVGTPPDSTADVVYGQLANFSTRDLNKGGGPSPNGLWVPGDVALDRDGNVYVADTGNNRVLFYLAGSTTATRVYGQGGIFTSGTGNKGGLSADSLLAPEAIVLDSNDNLYVADRGNNRVLFYPAGLTTATRVYGQAGDFTSAPVNSGELHPTRDGLWAPLGVALDSHDNLYVADHPNHRVLFYPAGSTIPERVYGQAGDFTTGTVNKGGRSADSLSFPWGLTLDRDDNLYVADQNNTRVLFYPAGSTTATRVYGQLGSFETAGAVGGPTADNLAAPEGVALDTNGNLYVADTGNHRVLFYPAGNTTATHVYGQGGSFTTGTTNKGGISANSLLGPQSVALDRAGNLYVADRNNNRVLRFDRAPDVIAPTATPTHSPAANLSGWNNTDVIVDWNWTDDEGGTGIDDANCTTSTTSSGQGDSITLSATCKDLAGNTGTASYTVKVDKTPPTVSLTTQSPAANGVGWNNSDVTVTWSWNDEAGGSGLDSANCTSSSMSSGEGNAITLTASCKDVAGNTGAASYVVKVDKTAPAVSQITQSPAANVAGWNNTDVIVAWNWADEAGGSGLDAANCAPSSTSSGEGNPMTLTGSCKDLAGNMATASYSVKVDKTPPTPSSISQSPAANGAGWNNTNVTVTWNWVDEATGSGVDGVNCTPSNTSSGEGNPITLSATCKDRAGNIGTSSYSVRVDKTGPTVFLVGGPSDGDTYPFGSVPAAPTCTASDALSGLNGGCTVAGYSTAVGSHTVTATATDKAGNQGSASATYNVVATWTLSGFYAPVDMGGVWNTLKAGSTVALKFEVFADSTELTDTAIVRQPLKATEVLCTGGPTDEVELLATGGTTLRYDVTSGQFIYNWQTPKKPGYCYVVTVTTTDGSVLTANFRLK